MVRDGVASTEGKNAPAIAAQVQAAARRKGVEEGLDGHRLEEYVHDAHRAMGFYNEVTGRTTSRYAGNPDMGALVRLAHWYGDRRSYAVVSTGGSTVTSMGHSKVYFPFDGSAERAFLEFDSLNPEKPRIVSMKEFLSMWLDQNKYETGLYLSGKRSGK
jgi:hypothetical protein